MLSVKNATTINRKPLKRVRETIRSYKRCGCKRPPFRKRSDCSVALFNIFRYLAQTTRPSSSDTTTN
ncbi:unnamed protein product [Tenebrio molitor]|nr:unnamed protein product [Tenebrio molitor]